MHALCGKISSFFFLIFSLEYQTAFRYLDVGYASALSITLLFMIILLSIAFIKVGGIDDRTWKRESIRLYPTAER